MNIPMFVPTLELLTEWHLDWSVMGERTWQAARAWQEEPSRYDLPTGSVIPAHANASHPHLDPNNEHDPVAIAHWLNFSDCKIHSILSLPLLPPPNYNCCTPPTRIRHCHRDSLRTRYLHHVWQCPHAALLTRSARSLPASALCVFQFGRRAIATYPRNRLGRCVGKDATPQCRS